MASLGQQSCGWGANRRWFSRSFQGMVLVLISASRWFGWQIQAMICARLTSRNCSGWRKPAKTMKSWMSCR
jgi:hypothetical protein